VSIDFNEEKKLLEDCLAKPKVEDGYLREEIKEIELMDLPLADPILLSKCEYMLTKNEWGIFFEDNNNVIRNNSLQENKMDEDHTNIAGPVVEQDRIAGASSQHKDLVNK